MSLRNGNFWLHRTSWCVIRSMIKFLAILKIRPSQNDSDRRVITTNPTRSGRQRWHPRRFLDFVPSVPAQLPHLPQQQIERPPPNPTDETNNSPLHPNSPSPNPAPPQKIYVTAPNEFGLFRVYRGRAPIHDPEQQFVLDSVCDSSTFDIHLPEQRPWWSGMGNNTTAEPKSPFVPFLNASTYRMVNWHYSSSETRSIADLDRLAKDVIGAPDFDAADVKDFNAAAELKRMDDYLDETWIFRSGRVEGKICEASTTSRRRTQSVRG